MPYILLSERLRRHLAKRVEAKSRESKVRGRKPKNVDYAACDIQVLRRRISTLRRSLRKSKNPDTVKRNAGELLPLERLLKHRTVQQSAATRRNKRNRVLKARAELARQRALDKQARTKEAILRNWQNRDHTRFASWLVSDMREAKVGRTYRPVPEGWAMLSEKVIKNCGFMNGDSIRDKFNRKTVRRFDGKTWHDTNIRDLNQYRGAILRAQPKPVTSTQNTPDLPKFEFDRTGMPPVPQFVEDDVWGVHSLNMAEEEAWKRANWPGWGKAIDAYRANYRAGLRQEPKPVPKPEPKEELEVDDWFEQHRAKMKELMGEETA